MVEMKKYIEYVVYKNTEEVARFESANSATIFARLLVENLNTSDLDEIELCSMCYEESHDGNYHLKSQEIMCF